MKKKISFLILALFTTTTVWAIDTIIRTDKVKMGRSVSSSDKTLEFDINLGANNTKITSNPSTQDMKLRSDVVTVGKAVAGNKTITIDNNAGVNNPQIRWNNALSKLQFSNNGTQFNDFGSGAGGLFAGGQNLLPNNSWEIDTSNWTASGGTYTRVTAAANIIPPGLGAASWDPSAASQTLTSNDVVVTANDGLSGRNGVLSCSFKTVATDLKMQVFDGTNVISPNAITDVVPSSSTGFIRYTVNFVFPTSGTIKARFLSQSDSAVAFIDDCFFGLAEGFNFANINSVSSWNGVYTFTPNSFGTVSTTKYLSRRVGDSLEARVFFTAGTVTGGTASITLPTGLLIDSARLTTQANSGIVGIWNIISSAAGPISISSTDKWGPIFFDGSDTGKVYFAFNQGSNQLNKMLGTDFGTGNGAYFSFLIPIQGWAAEQAYRPDQSANVWSGYHDSDCTWTTTNNNFVEPSADSTCTFVERTNVNFGTVTSQLSGSDKLPGIVFTPSSNGQYLVCARPLSVTNASGSFSYFQLYDGTNALATTGHQLNTNTSSYMCGYYNAVNSVPATIRIRMKSDAGNTNTLGVSLSGVPSIEWTLVKVTQSIPAPLLVNSVVSSSTGVEASERASVGDTACSASPCTIASQSGSWLTSITRSGAGTYALNISAGTFSARPTCNITGRGGTGVFCFDGSGSTSTVYNFVCRSDAGANTDSGFDIRCQGPR